jgi:CcmD family protein
MNIEGIEFIVAAFAITWLGLGAYLASLRVRARR